jgi:hypothetical protein
MKYIAIMDSSEKFDGKPLYSIMNKKSAMELAQIFWYAPWRRWCVRFEEESVWSEDCLKVVRLWIRDLEAVAAGSFDCQMANDMKGNA